MPPLRAQRRSLVGDRALIDPQDPSTSSRRHSLHDRMAALHAGPRRRISRCSCKGNMLTSIINGRRPRDEPVEAVYLVAEAVRLNKPSLHRQHTAQLAVAVLVAEAESALNALSAHLEQDDPCPRITPSQTGLLLQAMQQVSQHLGLTSVAKVLSTQARSRRGLISRPSNAAASRASLYCSPWPGLSPLAIPQATSPRSVRARRSCQSAAAKAPSSRRISTAT